MRYAPRPKQVRVPSQKMKCPHCNKDIFARGLKAHVRMAHGVQPTAVSGLDLFSMQDLKGIKGTNVPKKQPSFNTAQPQLTISEMLFVFGASWLLNEISKEMRKSKK